MNITRPQNYVSVAASLGIHFVLTRHLGTRLCLTAPCRSIMTILCTLESPSSLMEASTRLSSIPLPQVTNRGSMIHILIFLESDVSGIPSMLSCQRFIYIFLPHCLLLNDVPAQNTQVSETKQFRSSFIRQYESTIKLKSVISSVWCYRGTVAVPRWKDVDTRMSMLLKL
jgi:hypothetical protein